MSFKRCFLISFSIIISVLHAQTPILPQNNLTQVSNKITFEWNSCGTASLYDLELALDSSFANPASFLISNTDTILNLSPDLYFWRIRCNTNGVISNWSSINQFTIINFNNNHLQLWLAADSNVMLNGLRVQQWGDISSQNNDATQTTSFQQPTLKSALNKNAVTFDGINDFLTAQLIDTIDQQPYTVIALWNSLQSGTRVLASGTGVNGGNIVLSTGSVVKVTGVLSYPKLSPFDFAINTFKFNGLNSSIFENSVLQASGEAISRTFTDIVVGSKNGTSFFYNGDLAELIIIDTIIDAESQKSIEQYLQFKYAPPVLLGSDILVNYGYCDTLISAEKPWFQSYSWNTGATTSSILVNEPGTYSVTVTDIFGYTSTDDITIEFNTPVVDSNYLVCVENGLTIDLNITPAITYVWNGSDTSAMFYTQASGEYFYQIFDTLGCSFSDTLSLVIDSFNVQLDLGNDTSLCAGNEISLVNEGAVGASSYLWNTGDTVSSISVNSSGVYFVNSINANLCMASDSINVLIVGQSPLTNFIFDTVCAGSAVSLTNLSAAISPDTITSNTWYIQDDIIFTQDVNYLFDSAGIFEVTLIVESSVGCSSSISANIPVKPVPISYFELNSDACIYNSYLFSSSGSAIGLDTISQYLWSFGDGSVDDGQNVIYQYNLADTFIVTHEVVSSNGCSATFQDSLPVFANSPLPDSIFLTSPMNGFIGVKSNQTFSWLPSQNSASFVLEVSTDSSFTFLSHEVETALTSIFVNGLSPQPYFWRVGAISICGDTVYSKSYNFEIIDFTTGSLQIWLAADSNIILNGAGVQEWQDLSPNSNHFIQANSSLQPFVATALNNYSIRFDGLNDYIATNLADTLDQQPYTVISLWKNNETGARVLASGTGNNGGNIALSTGTEVKITGVLSYAKPSPFDFIISSFKFNGINSSIYENSILKANGEAISRTFTDIVIGSKNGTSLFLDGDVAEFFIFDTLLNLETQLQIEQYLRFKYAPPVNLGPDITIDYGYCDTSLSAQKDWFKSYLWNTGDTTSSIQFNKSGTYSVTVTDVFGYNSTDEVVVVYNQPNIDQNYVTCVENGFSLDLDVGQALTYVWNGLDTMSTFTTNSSGNYFYTIYDTIGCSFTDTLSLTVDSFSLVMSLGKDTSICTGNELLLVEEGNYSIESYLWSTGDISSNITIGGVSSSYWLEAENANGCLGADTLNTVILGIAPTANFSVDTLCASQQTLFLDQSLPSSSALNSWSWRFADIDQSSLPNPSTTFPLVGFYQVELQVGAVNGCFDDTTITVEVIQGPSANFSFDVICAGSSANLEDESFSNTANPVSSWFWDFGAGQTSNTQVPSFTLSNEGNYPVQLIVSNEYGCYDTINKLVEIFPALLPDFETEQICIGDTTLFTDITPSFSTIDRTWIFDFFGQTSTNPNPNFYYPNPGTYDVKLSLTNAIGCQSEVVKSIEIRDLPEVDLIYDNTCEGAESALFDASSTDLGSITSQIWIIDGEELAGDSVYYTFEDLGFNPVFLSVTDNFNCSNDTSILISVYPLPQADFDFSPNYGEAPIDIQFENLSSTDAVDFLWSFGDTSINAIDENPINTYNQNGVYEITLAASTLEGCTDSAIQTIAIIPTALDIKLSNFIIQKVDLGNGMTAYKPSVLMQNVGTRAIFNADLFLSINSETQIAETWEGVIPIGQSALYELGNFAIIGNESILDYVCIEAQHVNDNTELNFGNNKTCLVQNGSLKTSELYPNPAEETVHIDVITENDGESEIGVFDLLGKVIIPLKKVTLMEGFNQISINTTNLVAGKYIVQLIFQEEIYSYSLIIHNR